MRWLALSIAFVLTLALAVPAAAQGNPVTLTLPAVNGSGESGTISLTPSGSNLTELVIILNNQPMLQTKYQTINGQKVIDPTSYGGAVPQLAGIYSGSCANPTPTDPPSLGATTPNGPNVTGNGWLVIKMSVDQIVAGHYVLAVHKDGTATSPLVACAPLVAGPEQSASGSAASSTSSGASSSATSSSASSGALPQTGTPRALLGLLVLGGLGLVGAGWRVRRAERSANELDRPAADEREVKS